MRRVSKAVIDSTLYRYVFAGASSYLIELSFLMFLNVVLGLSAGFSAAIAFWVGLVMAFVLQKTFAFKDYKRTISGISKQLSFYVLLVVFNYVFTIFFVSVFPEKYLLISRTLALLLTTLWNFFIYKYIIFNVGFNISDTLDSCNKFILKTHSKAIKSNLFLSLVNTGAIIILIFCTTYGVVQSNKVTSLSADAIVNTYLAEDMFSSGEIYVQTAHTNLMKFPIFFVQSLFGNTYTTFSAVNLFLSIATVLGWLFVLGRVFGRKYVVLISLCMSSVLIASTAMNINLTWTTIRNIEFPLVLFYLYVVNKYVHNGSSMSRQENVKLLLVTLLYALILASDQFFQYTASLGVLAFLAFTYLQTRRLSDRMVMAGLSVIGASILAKVMIYLMDLSSLFQVHEGNISTSIVKYSRFYSSLSESFKQLVDLSGASIFGSSISMLTISFFVNMAVLLAAIYGGYLVFKKVNKRMMKSGPPIQANEKDSFMAVLALTATANFAVYVLTDQASQDSRRYMTFIALLVTPLFIWVIANYYYKHSVFKLFVLFVLLLSIASSLLRVPGQYDAIVNSEAIKKERYMTIGSTLNKEGVDFALTGYWLGSTTRFWSNDSVKYGSVIDCDKVFSVLAKPGWYVSENKSRTAIIVERKGDDAPFWSNCSDESIISKFGSPSKEIRIDSSRHIFIYNYDIREKLSL